MEQDDAYLRAGVIDTPLKFRILLVFCRHPGLALDAAQLGGWLRESPWALDEALHALADAGVVQPMAPQRPGWYQLPGDTPAGLAVRRLAWRFDDPLDRERIYARIDAADHERQLRAVTLAPQPATLGDLPPL
jgi:hypothetical protein